jgi:hypothetical protein
VDVSAGNAGMVVSSKARSGPAEKKRSSSMMVDRIHLRASDWCREMNPPFGGEARKYGFQNNRAKGTTR